MDERMIFAILGIERTKDENEIRAAYRTLLSHTNPEDDPEGFKRLREAYESALAYAKAPDENEQVEEPEDNTPVGQWMKQAREVYFSLSRRLNEEEWKRLIAEDICQDLEYGEEIRWRLFSFLAEHFHLTSHIYQILNETFRIKEDQEAFREHLPVDFVSYLLRRVDDAEGTMDFSFNEFEGADDADYDAFMRYYYDLSSQTQNEEGEAASQTIRAINELHIDHPLFRLERARADMLCGKEDEALEIIKPLVEERGDSLRIQVLGADILYRCGKKEDAVEILRNYEEEGYFLVEKYLSLYEKEKGNLALSIKHCLKALRDGDDQELEKMLEEMDDVFIRQFAPLAESDSLTDEDAACLVGCYSRRNRPQEGIDFLEKYPGYAGRMERLHEYLCSLYFQVERYEDSIAESRKWRENLPEDKKAEREARSYVFEGEGWSQLARKGEEGAYEKAKAAYEEAVRLAPQDFNIKQRILDTLILMEQYEDAVKLADAIIAENEGWFPAYAQKQKACFELHQAQEVIDNFYRAKNIYAGYPAIYERAMEVFCIFGQYSDADNILRQANEAEVSSPMLDVLRLRSDRLKEWKAKQEKQETDKEALTRLAEELKAKYEKEPAEKEIMGKLFQELGLLMRDRGDYKTAARYFRKAIHHDDVPFYHYTLANALFDSGTGEEALKEYRFYEKQSGPDEDLYINMARCYRFVHKSEESIAYFKKVLEVNEKNEEANGAIAGLYRNMLVDTGNIYYGKLGLPYADRQMELTPRDGYYLRERGLMYLEMNLWKEALAEFTESLEVEPENPYGWNLKGKAYYYLGQNEEAMKCFLKAVNHMGFDPGDRFSGPYLNAGDCMRRQGRYQDAEDWYKKGIEVFTPAKSYSFYQRLFWMYRICGRFEDAKEMLRQQRKHSLIGQETFERDTLLMDELRHAKSSESYVERGKQMAKTYDSIDAWEELARLYLYEADNLELALEAALTAFKKAKKAERLWEENSVPLLVAMCYKLMGDQKQASTYSTTFRFELQKAYNYNQSQGATEQYINDMQENVENMFDLARCYLFMGELEEAEKYLAEMHKQGLCRKCCKGGCSELFELEGMICEEKGEIEAAIANYKKALQIDPCMRFCTYRIEKLGNGGGPNKGKDGKPKKKKSGFAFWRRAHEE